MLYTSGRDWNLALRYHRETGGQVSIPARCRHPGEIGIPPYVTIGKLEGRFPYLPVVGIRARLESRPTLPLGSWRAGFHTCPLYPSGRNWNPALRYPWEAGGQVSVPAGCRHPGEIGIPPYVTLGKPEGRFPHLPREQI